MTRRRNFSSCTGSCDTAEQCLRPAPATVHAVKKGIAVIPRAFSVVVACAAVGAVSVLAAGSASAQPTISPGDTGCPTGYQVLSVEELIALDEDYGPLRDVDTNKDGVVCGRSLPAAAGEQVCAECGVPVVYLFRDNDLTARR
jgi:hypothetical protein